MKAVLTDALVRYCGAQTYKFGDGAALSARLIGLVRGGKKRATCSCVLDVDADGAMPEIGRCDIVLNWDDTPALVTRTEELCWVHFCDMTKEMALMEGEDETLAGWLKGHRKFYERCGVFHPKMPLLWERFEMIEDFADVR